MNERSFQEDQASNEKQALSRAARKQTGQKQKRGGLSFAALIKTVFLVMLVALAAVLATSMAFLSHLDDEGIAAQRPGAEDNLNILIMGIDGGVLEGGSHMIGRSDVLMLLSFDRQHDRAMLLSIPRDTRVNLDEVGETKINAAHVFGGSELTLAAVEELTSQTIHYFVKIDFEGFKAIVDAAGGVDLDVEKRMYYEDPYADPVLIIDLQPGWQHLDGAQAEQYVRYRDEVGDIGRVGQQKKLVLALIKQFINPLNLWRLPATAQQAQQYLKTNMQPQDILGCAWAYLSLKEEPVSETLPGQGNYDGSYWLPDYIDIDALFERDAAAIEESGRGWLDFSRFFQQAPAAPAKQDIRLIVLNGNGITGSATEAADELKEEQYQIIEIGDADHYNYEQSVIRYGKGAEDKARVLQESFADALIEEAPEPLSSCDLILIVGGGS